MRRLLLVVLPFVLVGCGGKHYWFKPGATAQEFYRDSLECAKEAAPERTGQAQEKLKVNKDLYRACLYARGYVREERFEIPPKDGWRGIE